MDIKMLIELALNQPEITIADIQKATFLSIERKVSVLSVPILYLPLAQEYVKGTNVVLAASIDCPYGQSPTELRHAAIILAERRGAEIVELGINAGWIKDKKDSELRTDIKTCLEVCKSKNLSLRLVLEYRLFDDAEVAKYCEFFQDLGVDYIISSFGMLPDDPSDNLLLAKKVAKQVKYLPASNLWQPKHIEMAKASKVKSIRFLSVPLFERCIIK
jgi:deoxyribose-phosphate aldolase